MSCELAGLLPEADLIKFEGVTHMGPMLLKAEAQPVFGRYVTFIDKVLDQVDTSASPGGYAWH